MRSAPDLQLPGFHLCPERPPAVVGADIATLQISDFPGLDIAAPEAHILDKVAADPPVLADGFLWQGKWSNLPGRLSRYTASQVGVYCIR